VKVREVSHSLSEEVQKGRLSSPLQKKLRGRGGKKAGTTPDGTVEGGQIPAISRGQNLDDTRI